MSATPDSAQRPVPFTNPGKERTTDNGAVRWDPVQGSNAPLKGWGYDTSEGAQRVPCIARWPGRIPTGVVQDEIVTMMDIFPTVAALAGIPLPIDRAIDGNDAGPILFGRANARSPYDQSGFFYYHMHQLQAVRAGRWKLYLQLKNKIRNLGGDYSRGENVAAELYDVSNDPGETREVSSAHPDVCHQLTLLADDARRDLGDWDHDGANQRSAGWVGVPTPRLLP